MDEEEEEFDGASIQLTDGNERRATVAETRVKHPCRIYVGRTGTGCFLEGNDPLPGDYGLAWLLVRLAHLEVRTLTFSATADPGPSGESFLDLVGCGRKRPAGAVFLV